jgi:DNA-binding MltR family transcriptional regulator
MKKSSEPDLTLGEGEAYLIYQIPRVIDFRDALRKETDRGCALYAAAFIDDSLKDLLTYYFVDDEQLSSDLLDSRQNGPLSTFYARIIACRALGLVSKAVARDLDLIRKIRNEFAHSAEPVTFNASEVANRCRELKYVLLAEDDASPRTTFTNAVSALLAIVVITSSQAEHREALADVDLWSDEMNEYVRNLAEAFKAMEQRRLDRQKATSE